MLRKKAKRWLIGGCCCKTNRLFQVKPNYLHGSICEGNEDVCSLPGVICIN